MKQIACYLVLAVSIIGMVPRAEAGLSPSRMIPSAEAERTSDLALIQKILEQKMVREKLAAYGLTQDDINCRMNRLNDQQVHELALNLDQIRSGGISVAAGFAALFVIFMIGFLYFYFGTDMTEENQTK